MEGQERSKAAEKWMEIYRSFKSGKLEDADGNVITDQNEAAHIATRAARKIKPSYGQYVAGGEIGVGDFVEFRHGREGKTRTGEVVRRVRDEGWEVHSGIKQVLVDDNKIVGLIPKQSFSIFEGGGRVRKEKGSLATMVDENWYVDDNGSNIRILDETDGNEKGEYNIVDRGVDYESDRIYSKSEAIRELKKYVRNNFEEVDSSYAKGGSMARGGEVEGTYGGSKTESTIYTYEERGGTWYVADGSKNVNFTYDPVEEGVDIEELSDVDVFTWSSPIESASELEDAVDFDGEEYARGGGVRVSNQKSSEHVESRTPFRANNLDGVKLDNGVYVVLSYGYYPLWLYKRGKWYGNSEKYSVSTSKQQTQSRPSVGEIKMITTDDLYKKAGTSNFGLGGFIFGAAIGGYAGYKMGRSRPQKKGFDTEKKIGKSVGKGIKDTAEAASDAIKKRRGKKASKGGSMASGGEIEFQEDRDMRGIEVGDLVDFGGGRIKYVSILDGNRLIVVDSEDEIGSSVGQYIYPSLAKRILKREDEEYADGGSMASGGEITYKIENYHSGYYLDDKEFDSEEEATNYLYETLDIDDEDFDDWYVMGEYYKDGKWVKVPIEYAKGGSTYQGGGEVEKDIEQLKTLPYSHRFIYVKDFSDERLKNIADELDIPYEEHDDIQDRVIRYFHEEYSKGGSTTYQGGGEIAYVKPKNLALSNEHYQQLADAVNKVVDKHGVSQMENHVDTYGDRAIWDIYFMATNKIWQTDDNANIKKLGRFGIKHDPYWRNETRKYTDKHFESAMKSILNQKFKSVSDSYAKGGGIPTKFYWIEMDRDKIDEYIDYASRMRGLFENEIYTQGVNRVAFVTDDDRFSFTSMIENHNNDNDLNEGDEGYIFYKELYGDKAMPNIFDKISRDNYAKGGSVSGYFSGDLAFLNW